MGGFQTPVTPAVCRLKRRFKFHHRFSEVPPWLGMVHEEEAVHDWGRTSALERAEISHPLFPPVDPHTVPPQSAIAHGACYQSTHTASPCIANATHQHPFAITRGKGGDGGLVAGSATTTRHRFPRQTHAHNFRGVVCSHIQSPKHLESTFVEDLPHHQA